MMSMEEDNREIGGEVELEVCKWVGAKLEVGKGYAHVSIFGREDNCEDE